MICQPMSSGCFGKRRGRHSTVVPLLLQSPERILRGSRDAASIFPSTFREIVLSSEYFRFVTILWDTAIFALALLLFATDVIQGTTASFANDTIATFGKVRRLLYLN
jgi:hypothetical protein